MPTFTVNLDDETYMEVLALMKETGASRSKAVVALIQIGINTKKHLQPVIDYTERKEEPTDEIEEEPPKEKPNALQNPPVANVSDISHISAFLEERTRKGETRERIPKSELYEKFNEYCKETKYPKIPKPTFFKIIKTHFHDLKDNDYIRPRSYIGIAFKEKF